MQSGWKLNSASQANFRTNSESCVRSPVPCLRSAFFLFTWTVSSVRPDSLCMSMMETFQTDISRNWSLLSTERHSIPGQVRVSLCITPYHSWNDALLLYHILLYQIDHPDFFFFFVMGSPTGRFMINGGSICQFLLHHHPHRSHL